MAFQRNVVPTNRKDRFGNPIYQAAPTQTDVTREANEQRVQVFAPGGNKISDTQRVAVKQGGEIKWVTPEHAMQQTQPGTIKYREAQKKEEARQKLEQTIRARYEREAEEAKQPTQGVKLVEQQGETSYVIGKIPNKDARIVSKGQLEAENRLDLVKKSGLPPMFINKAMQQSAVENKLGLLASGISPMIIERTGYYKQPIASEVGTTTFGNPKLTGNTLSKIAYGTTIFVAGTQKKKEDKRPWATKYLEDIPFMMAEDAAAIYNIGKGALYEPVQAAVPQKLKSVLPTQRQAEAVGTFAGKASSEFTSELLTKKGVKKTAIFAAVTIPLFVAGGWAAESLAAGTKVAKYGPMVGKAVGYGFGTLWAGSHAVSGGLRIASGEDTARVIGSETGSFIKEAAVFGAVGLGYKYAIKGVTNIRKTYTPQRLVEANVRFGTGKEGTKMEVTEFKVEQGKPVNKWFWEPKPKPQKTVTFDIISDTTSMIGEGKDMFGTVTTKMKVRGKVEPSGIKVTKVLKTESIIPREISYGNELTLGNVEFAKKPSQISTVNVKGYEYLRQKLLKELNVYDLDIKRIERELSYPKEKYVSKAKMKKMRKLGRVVEGIYFEPEYLVKDSWFINVLGKEVILPTVRSEPASWFDIYEPVKIGGKLIKTKGGKIYVGKWLSKKSKIISLAHERTHFLEFEQGLVSGEIPSVRQSVIRSLSQKTPTSYIKKYWGKNYPYITSEKIAMFGEQLTPDVLYHASQTIKSGRPINPSTKAGKAFADFYFPEQVQTKWAGLILEPQEPIKVKVEPYTRLGAEIKYKYGTKGTIPQGESLIRYGEVSFQPTTRQYTRKTDEIIQVVSNLPSTKKGGGTDITSRSVKQLGQVQILKNKFDIGELRMKEVPKNVFIDISVPEARQIALQNLKPQPVTKRTKPTVSYKQTTSVLNKGLNQISQMSAPTFTQQKKYPFVGQPYEEVRGGQKLIAQPEITLIPQVKTKPTFDYIKGTALNFEMENRIIDLPIVKTIKESQINQRQTPKKQLTPITDVFKIKNPIVDITEIQEQDQGSIISPIFMMDYINRIPTRLREPIREVPPQPPPFKPFFPGLDFLGGEGIYRPRGKKGRKPAYTPDFIASVLNQFGKGPSGNIFTGQERRFKVKGKNFISPLPKKGKGIVQLIFGG
jgi:hypothetical protein